MGVGFEFAAGVGGMCLVGYWIGRFYGNPTLGLLIGAALGLIGSMYNVIRVALKISSRANRSRSQSDEHR